MDPYETYLNIFAAMKAGKLEVARELALALQDWFAGKGFYPYEVTLEAMQSYMASVLRRTAGNGPEPVFTLVCQECDAGEELASEEEAIEAGWSEIETAFDLPQANYCGLCPDCRKERG